jgi:hypothetical protein
MSEVIISQTVAMLIDGNNIGKSIKTAYGQDYMMDFYKVVPKILNGRKLNRLIYLREGKHISERLAGMLRRKYMGKVIPCDKSADVTLTIDAVKLADKVDTIVIFSGDGDYIPLVVYLRAVGVRVEVVCAKHSASPELIKEADNYYFLQYEDVYSNNDGNTDFKN